MCSGAFTVVSASAMTPLASVAASYLRSMPTIAFDHVSAAALSFQQAALFGSRVPRQAVQAAYKKHWNKPAKHFVTVR